jgi:uncharacterized alkaline shock family protein YloU
MRFRIRVAMFFYLVIVTVAGLKLILFALQVFPLKEMISWVETLYQDEQARWLLGGVGLGLLCLNYMFMRTIVGEETRGKTIAFDNPSGRVTVSLSAMEDLVRRLVSREPEVKEVRATITARKRRLEADVRVVLNADSNIPDLTQGLQDMIRNKIQDTIGPEETVVVRMHVTKIVMDYKNKTEKEKARGTKADDTLPFPGYRP